MKGACCPTAYVADSLVSYLLVDYSIIARRLASVGEDEPHPASGLATRRRTPLTLDDETRTWVIIPNILLFEKGRWGVIIITSYPNELTYHTVLYNSFIIYATYFTPCHFMCTSALML